MIFNVFYRLQATAAKAIYRLNIQQNPHATANQTQKPQLLIGPLRQAAWL